MEPSRDQKIAKGLSEKEAYRMHEVHKVEKATNTNASYINNLVQRARKLECCGPPLPTSSTAVTHTRMARRRGHDRTPNQRLCTLQAATTATGSGVDDACRRPFSPKTSTIDRFLSSLRQRPDMDVSTFNNNRSICPRHDPSSKHVRPASSAPLRSPTADVSSSRFQAQ